MTKKRKQHQLIATINNAYLGYAKSKTYQDQPFYCCQITEHTLLGNKKSTVYAFANLVSQEIWQTLADYSFKDKKYLLCYEKRTRGWRLKDWQEHPQ